MEILKYKNINGIKNPSLKELAAEIAFLQEKRNNWLGIFGLKVAPNEKKRKNMRLNAIKKLQDRGIFSTNNKKTFFTKYLSSGCISCMRGETYNFVPTFNCNKECFFCYQPRFQYKAKVRKSIYHSPVINVRELIKKDKLESFSISGGESLLAIGKVIKAICLVKSRFGPSCKTHLYTNGDFVTTGVLKQLKSAGLDEIRFNLAANNYRLTSVYLAQDYISDVIVEIPVIPGDEIRAKNLMAQLNRIGIFCLNLHELLFFGYNPAIYKKRGYMLKTAKKRPFYSELATPIYSSEEAAFRLLEFAVQKRYSISVHYCSSSAKQDIQHIRKRYNYAKDALKPYEKITKNGLLEKLIVYEPECSSAIKDLKQNNVPREQINISSERKRLEVHPRNLAYLNLKEYEVGIARSLPDSRDVDIKVMGMNPASKAYRFKYK